jgi:hypothetical protein
MVFCTTSWPFPALILFAIRNLILETFVAMCFPRGLGNTVERVTFTFAQLGARPWIFTNLFLFLAEEAAVATAGLATGLATSTALGARPLDISNLATNHPLAILCGHAPVIVATVFANCSARACFAALI